MKCYLYYKKSELDDWKLNGYFSKTDALGTANNWLKYGYLVMIVPNTLSEDKDNE